MSIEKRRRYKRKKNKGENKQEKTPKKRRFDLPKKELTKEEIEARKKAQRRAMFDKKKNLFKK